MVRDTALAVCSFPRLSRSLPEVSTNYARANRVEGVNVRRFKRRATPSTVVHHAPFDSIAFVSFMDPFNKKILNQSHSIPCFLVPHFSHPGNAFRSRSYPFATPVSLWQSPPPPSPIHHAPRNFANSATRVTFANTGNTTLPPRDSLYRQCAEQLRMLRELLMQHFASFSFI